MPLPFPNLDTVSARIKIQGRSRSFDISDANVTVVSSSSSAGIAVTGSLFLSEGGAFAPVTETYTVALRTTPTSSVNVTVTADEQLVVSVDGATFASSVSFTRADTSPQTVTVRPRNDRDSEGAHRGVIRHAITASSDPAYATEMIIDQRVAEIADDEQPPLIAVDFQPAGKPVPRN